MKQKISYFCGAILPFFTTIFLFSCSKEEEKNEIVDVPKIEQIELGHNNSKTGKIGDEIHIEARFSAEGSIKEVKLQIQYQKGTSSFYINESFPDLVGLKGGDIHKHFDIPTDAQEGNYNFLLNITDKNEKITEVKDVLAIEKKIDYTENDNLPLNTLQLGILNNSITMKKEDFISKLEKNNISYEWTEDFEPQLIYYASREMASFQKYKITVAFEDVFDLDIRPYERYKGVGSISIVPVDDNKEDLQSKKLVENFTFLDNYISSFANNPYKYKRYNDDKDYSYEQFTKESFYKSLSTEDLGSASIFWNKNPNATAENSSKEKNTPKIMINYNYETQNYQIVIEFNRPDDYFKYLKNN
ncbi:MAG: DUF4625 domain-containing protein [Capnocytophaga sp.]|nr:DUF4625 domain-containing protein [Capnocytophaga sp.]